MTVSSSASRNQYTATAGQTVFAYTFEIVSDDDIVVLKNGVTLTKTADYTVSGVGVDSGGNVTLTSGATAGDILTLYRDMPYDRTTDYTNAGDFLAADVNNDFDRLWIATQQVNEEVNRSIKAPVTDPLTIDMTIPAKADRAGNYLAFDANGNPVAGAPTTGTIVGNNYVVNDFTGDGSTTVFTLTQSPGSKNNVQIYIDGVYQQKDTFSISLETLTFSEAPPNNSSIECILGDAIVSGGDANSLTYTYPAASARTRTVQAKLEESVSVKDFGAVGDGVTDDTAAIQAAFNIGGTIYVPPGTYLIDAISTSNDIVLIMQGSLKHKNNSSGDMITCTGDFKCTDGSVDGNKANQTANRTLFNLAGSKEVFFENVDFTNVHHCAIEFGKVSDEATRAIISGCSFTDGVLHDGILDSIQCLFIKAYPTELTEITNCKFIQTSAPAAGESRNPGGIFFGSSSTTKSLNVKVSGCYFENLGHNVAGNIAGSVDVYGFRDTVIYENNVVRTPRMLGLRVTNFKTALIQNNTIYQDCDNIVDGGSTYTSSSSISISLINRGYTENQRVNATAVISNNTVEVTGDGGNLPYLIYVASDSTTTAYHYELAKIESNSIIGNSNSNSIFISGLANASVYNNSIESAGSVRITNTLLGSLSGKQLNYQIEGNKFNNNDIGVFCRETSVSPNTSCNVWVRNNIFNSTTNAFTFRYLGNIYVTENIMPSNNNGDVNTNSSFYYKNNALRFASDPTGYSTNTYYRLTDNIGRSDQASP